MWTPKYIVVNIELPPGAKRRPVTTVAAKIFRSILHAEYAVEDKQFRNSALRVPCFNANSPLQVEMPLQCNHVHTCAVTCTEYHINESTKRKQGMMRMSITFRKTPPLGYNES